LNQWNPSIFSVFNVLLIQAEVRQLTESKTVIAPAATSRFA
jgi:hypothetical protein